MGCKLLTVTETEAGADKSPPTRTMEPWILFPSLQVRLPSLVPRDDLSHLLLFSVKIMKAFKRKYTWVWKTNAMSMLSVAWSSRRIRRGKKGWWMFLNVGTRNLSSQRCSTIFLMVEEQSTWSKYTHFYQRNDAMETVNFPSSTDPSLISPSPN